ncbi:hypothetical protein C7S15_7094 [Burkholderia cepacia]|nr:hypothetical protein [Burkholderia cepacia]
MGGASCVFDADALSPPDRAEGRRSCSAWDGQSMDDDGA